jgi:glucose-1-phosphate thymidylyltransferase
MKGVLLAGGTGSRLHPLTASTNKHLLPVGKLPMIYWPIARMLEADVTEIMVVTGREHMGAIVNLLGSGGNVGAKFTYRVQDEAGGIAQALGLAEHFVGDDSCVVFLGDNIFTQSIAHGITSYSGKGAKVFLKEVPDPKRYGVAELDGERVVEIEEKPEAPKSNFAVTGCYIYEDSVFSVIKRQKPSTRGELEITDVNNVYVEANQMDSCEVTGHWTDAGTFTSLLRANQLVAELEIPEVLRALI